MWKSILCSSDESSVLTNEFLSPLSIMPCSTITKVSRKDSNVDSAKQSSIFNLYFMMAKNFLCLLSSCNKLVKTKDEIYTQSYKNLKTYCPPITVNVILVNTKEEVDNFMEEVDDNLSPYSIKNISISSMMYKVKTGSHDNLLETCKKYQDLINRQNKK
jgi:hypothetical protein